MARSMVVEAMQMFALLLMLMTALMVLLPTWLLVDTMGLQRFMAPEWGVLGELINVIVHTVPICAFVIIDSIYYGHHHITAPGFSSAKYLWLIDNAIVFLLMLVVGWVNSRIYRYLSRLSGEHDAVPLTHRPRFIIYLPEVQLLDGASEFIEVKEELGSKVLPQDDARSIQVSDITENIIEAAKKIIMQLQPHDFLDEWEVIVVEDDEEINAWCLPGCKIAVYTGLLRELEGDAEIATVLSHEVSHAIAKHAVEQVANNTLVIEILKFYKIFARFVMLPSAAADFLMGILHKYWFARPLSRRMELEADRMGLSLLAATGYDPRNAPSVFVKLAGLTGDSESSDYRSTHPSWMTRAENILQPDVQEEALGLYHEAQLEVRHA